jgi:hypothetical protein
MSFTQAVQNTNNFSEIKSNDTQPLVTNNLGRTVEQYELVYLDGYFGEVLEYGGIADGATGRINIDGNREIRTEQVEETDTFTIGNTLWFASGGSGAAGKLEDADPGIGTRVACGIITGEEGSAGAQTAVQFRPFLQRLDAADVSAEVATLQAEMLVEQAEPKKIKFAVEEDASSGIAITGLSEGDEIIGVKSICTATNASGTLKITDGADNDITDAMQQATDKEVAYAASVDDAYSTLPATGAKVIANGSADRGILIIEYIPA